MIFAYLCVNCGSLWVSSVAQYEVMNRHVYLHNNNVVRILKFTDATRKGRFTLHNFCLQLSHAIRLQLELYNVN